MVAGKVQIGQGLIQALGKHFHRPLEPVPITLDECLSQRLDGAPPLHRKNPLEILSYNLPLRLRHVGQHVALKVHLIPLPPRPGKLGHHRLADGRAGSTASTSR